MLGDCRVPPAAGEPLPAFFNCWMDHALDTAGEFQLRLCALAVARLLCSKHPALESIKVSSKHCNLFFPSLCCTPDSISSPLCRVVHWHNLR